MSHKKIGLFVILAIASILFGAVIGLLDIFGFIDGRHTLSFTLLLSSALLIYIVLITVFLLNFAKRSRMYTFFAVSTVLFGITFFMMNLNIVLTVLTSLLFFTYLTYVFQAGKQRSQLFITFSPRELFFPILRKSFTFFLILVSVLSYIQTQKLVTQNSLISPDFISLVSKPTIFMLNQQLSSQFGGEQTLQILDSVPEEQREVLISRALRESINKMAQNKSGTVYGFKPSEIPIEEVNISSSGQVDITPVVEKMLPNIAGLLNEKIAEYAFIAPLIVALLAFLLLQPVIIPLQIIESALTLLIFKILLASKFIVLKTEPKNVEIPVL